MNLISIDNISKTHGDKILFDGVSFGVENGEKIALIGVNGSGKTTLLNMIAGIEQPDRGQICRNNGLKISRLPQTPVYNPEHAVSEHIFANGGERIELIKKYELLNSRVKTSYDHALQCEIDALTHKMNECGAWHFEALIGSVLEKLGISNLELKMKELSGGMLKKVALAAALIDESDALLLDEPTNHLDIQTAGWLEDYLKKTTKAIIMVTHDRYFLDRVCGRIIEIEKNKIIHYYGNYSYYLEKKADMLNSEAVCEARNKTVLRKELEWLGRGAKARSTKQKAHVERVMQLKASAAVPETATLDLMRGAGRRCGKKILELKDISKSFGAKNIINPFSYTFKKNERIGIIGPNGSGKTTFLNLITGRLETGSGVIDLGLNTVFGYFDQYSSALDEESTIIDFAKKSAEFIQTEDNKYVHVSEMLERFLFPPQMHYTKISKLSGGERRRLYLLYVLMQNPNFLIFDEPTNDIDIKTLSVLEDYLDNFNGCLLVVSHDRYFMDRLCGYLLVFDGNGNIDGFAGNFSDYLEYIKILEEDEKKNISSSTGRSAVMLSSKLANDSDKNSRIKTERKKFSFNEKKEYENIMGEIEKLENEKSELESLFESGETSSEKLSSWTRRYEWLQNEIAFKIARWEYLENIAQN